MRAAAGVMALVFAFAAAVQWNDPDPLAWIAFYLLLAAASLGRTLGWAWARIEGAAALMGGIVVVRLAPALADARSEAFTSFHMRSSEDELVRELGGAALGLGWSLVLLLYRLRRGAGGGLR